MNPLRQKWLARVLLALAVVLGGGALLWLQPATRISTDVLDLIPADERDPQLTLARELTGRQQARVVLFALDLATDASQRAAGTEAFVAALRESGAFAEVMPMQDPANREALGRRIFQQRFDLLLPGWLEARRRLHAQTAPEQPWPDWLAEHTAQALENFLGQPEAVGFQDLLPADPLLLMPPLVELAQRFDTTAADASGPVLIWALAQGSPFQEEAQRTQLQAVAAAEACLRRVAPEAKVRWTSVARFASESRRRIEGELSSLNVISLVAVILLAAVSLRRVFKAVHLAPVMLGGLLGGWVVTLAVFPQVHVLVFVVGSLLGGVAVDYGFYLYLQPPAFPGEDYAGKAHRLMKPLLASALTTVLGFLLLLFSELPLIRQLGVFVSAGLLSALGTALLWFAQVEVPFMETRAFIRHRPQPGARFRRWSRVVLAVGAVVACAGLGTLQWRDDIRELEIPAPALHREAREVRTLFGDTPARTAYLTHGVDVAAARQALARFEDWHRERHPGAATLSLGSVVPTPTEWAALAGRRSELPDFPAKLEAALGRHGFNAQDFAAFGEAWSAWCAAPLPAYEALAGGFAGSLRGPLGLMLSVTPSSCWFVTVAAHPPAGEPPADSGTVSLSQLENLNQLFGRYRRSALWLSALGLGLIGASVLALYGVWRGLRIFALPAGSCLVAFGALGLAGQTLNLFHLLGAFLGVCLSHNYAIFSAENAARRESPPPSIRLSALSTAASFGVLALSQIPVVAALGLTVALIVLISLLSVELEPAAGAPVPPTPPAA